MSHTQLLLEIRNELPFNYRVLISNTDIDTQSTFDAIKSIFDGAADLMFDQTSKIIYSKIFKSGENATIKFRRLDQLHWHSNTPAGWSFSPALACFELSKCQANSSSTDFQNWHSILQKKESNTVSKSLPAFYSEETCQAKFGCQLGGKFAIYSPKVEMELDQTDKFFGDLSIIDGCPGYHFSLKFEQQGFSTSSEVSQNFEAYCNTVPNSLSMNSSTPYENQIWLKNGDSYQSVTVLKNFWDACSYSTASKMTEKFYNNDTSDLNVQQNAWNVWAQKEKGPFDIYATSTNPSTNNYTYNDVPKGFSTEFCTQAFSRIQNNDNFKCTIKQNGKDLTMNIAEMSLASNCGCYGCNIVNSATNSDLAKFCNQVKGQASKQVCNPANENTQVPIFKSLFIKQLLKNCENVYTYQYQDKTSTYTLDIDQSAESHSIKAILTLTAEGAQPGNRHKHHGVHVYPTHESHVLRDVIIVASILAVLTVVLFLLLRH